MSRSHTPGPWRAMEGSTVSGYFIEAENGSVVAQRVPRSDLSLIAEAPDMLDILQTIELGLKRKYTPAELLDENSPIRERIRASIAKVTGE